MDNRKDNIKQAVYELFGVGAKPEIEINDIEDKKVSATPAPAAKKAPEKAAPAAAPAATPAAAPAEPAKKIAAAASYLAAGTMLEGSIRAKGDIEMSGEFKGEIVTDGTVVLRAATHANITAHSLILYGCSLTGDAVISDIVTINQNSSVCGNITAKELICAGKITGDIKLTENATIENTSHINGNIVTGTISVSKGAVIKGNIEIA